MREARTSPRAGDGAGAGRGESAGGAALDTPWMLEPRHVVPRDLGRSGANRPGELVQIRRARAPCEERENRPQQDATAQVQEVGVVEIRMHDARKGPPAHERAGE